MARLYHFFSKDCIVFLLVCKIQIRIINGVLIVYQTGDMKKLN